MFIRPILKIILDNNLCQNWEIEKNSLCLYFKHFNLYIFEEKSKNDHLFTIMEICLSLKKDEQKMLKKILQKDGEEVFCFDNKVLIQTRYKYFDKEIIEQHKNLYFYIKRCISLLAHDKKTIYPYPIKHDKLNKNGGSPYPIPQLRRE